MDLPQPLPSGNAWSVQMAEDGLTFERVQASPALPEVSTPSTAPPLTLWAWKPEAPQDARSSPRGWPPGHLPRTLSTVLTAQTGWWGGGLCIPDEGEKARKTSQRWEKRQIGPLFPISLMMRLQKTGLSTFPQKTVCETPSLPVPFQAMPCYLVPRTLDVIH